MITEELLVKLGLQFDDAGKLRAANGQFVNLAKAQAEAARAGKTLEEVLKQTADAAAKSKKPVGEAADAVSAFHSAVLRVAGPAAALAVLVKGLKESVAAFAEFEVALVGVGKTTDLAGAALQSLGRGFQDLSQEIPVSAAELANIGKAAGALGVRGADNILNFSETVAKMATATDLAAEEGAMSLKKLLDLTSSSVDQVDELASVIVRLGNNFATTESQIVRTALDLGRAVGVFGVTYDQVAALSAAMAALGVRAELGGSVVGRAFREIDKAIRTGGVPLEQLQKLTKMSGEQLRKTFAEDANAVFLSFLEGLKRVGAEGSSLELQLKKLGLEGDEVNKVLPVMANRLDIVTDALRQANEETKNAKALNEEARRAFETLAAQYEMTSNAVKNLASDIGGALAPAMRSILSEIKDMAEGLRNLVEASKRLGFLETVKGAANVSKLTGRITELTAERNKLFEAIEFSKRIEALEGAEQEKTALRLKGLTDIYGNLFVAQDKAALSTADMIKQFENMGLEISTLTDQVADLQGNLLPKAAMTIKAPQLAAPPKVPRIIKPEIDEDAAKRAFEVLKKLQEAVNDTFEKTLEVNASTYDTYRVKAAAEIQSLQLLAQEVALSKDLTGGQKARALATIKDLQGQQGMIALLKMQKDAREALKDITKETLDLALDFATIGKTDLEVLRLKAGVELEYLALQQKELEKEKEINAAAIDAMKARIDTFKALTEERAFQIQIKTTSEFSQVFAEAIRDTGAAFNQGIISFNEAWGTGIDQFSTEAVNAFAVGAAQIADAIGAVVDVAATAVASFFDPDTIEGVADALTSLVDKLPGLLVTAFNALAAAFTKIIDKLPQIVSQLFDNLDSIISKLVDMMPALVDKLADALEVFLDRLPDITEKIFNALPGIFDRLLSRLPDIILKLFNSIGTIIAQVIKVLPEILKTLFDHIPDIVEAVIQGLLEAMGSIAAAFVDWFVSGGAERMVGALIRAIPRLVVAIVNALAVGLKNALGKVFGGVKIPAAVTDIPQKFVDGVKNLAAKATEEASQLFKVLDFQAGARGIATAEKIGNAIDAATARLATTFKGLIDGLLAAWRWVYDNIIQPLVTGLITAWRWVYDNVVQPLINGLREVWIFVYETVIQPLINGLRAVWQAVYDGIIKPLLDGLRAVWQGVYDGVIKPLLDGLRSVWQAVYDSIMKPFISTLQAAWQFVVDLFQKGPITAFTNLWNNTKAMLDGVVGGFRSVFKTFTDGFDTLLTLARNSFRIITNFSWPSIPAPAWLDKLTNITGGGGGGGGGGVLGQVGKALGFSAGGVVPPIYAASGMMIPRGTDTVPAMLSPGEFVLSRGAVDALGIGNVQALNRGQMPGGGNVTNHYDIDVNVSFDGMPDEAFIRTTFVPVLKRELKKATQAGELIISRRGVFDK